MQILCLVQWKIFFDRKTFLGENIFQKINYFQVFSCIQKNTLKNIFLSFWLWKIYILLLSHIFLNSQTHLIKKQSQLGIIDGRQQPAVSGH